MTVFLFWRVSQGAPDMNEAGGAAGWPGQNGRVAWRQDASPCASDLGGRHPISVPGVMRVAGWPRLAALSLPGRRSWKRPLLPAQLRDRPVKCLLAVGVNLVAFHQGACGPVSVVRCHVPPVGLCAAGAPGSGSDAIMLNFCVRRRKDTDL